MTDYYKILDVPEDASAADIRRAYKSMAQMYHPDRNDDPGASDLFASINKAYKILNHPESRKAYDETGSAEQLDLMRKVQSKLAQGLSEYIQKNIDDTSEQPRISDLINHFKDMKILQIKGKQIIKSRLKKLEKMNGKVKIKQYTDMYDRIYQDTKIALSDDLRTTEEQIDVLRQVVHVLEGAEESGIEETLFINYVDVNVRVP